MKPIKLVQLIILMCGSYTFAQFGVGTTSPNASAQLEVVSNNKGILIPQLALTSIVDTSTITNGNIESLLVYNTSNASGLTPGYYYWSNSKWNRLATTENSSSVSVDDNLTSTSTANALSAYQGLVLKGLVDVNTSKVGITTAEANAIVANTAKTGITTVQAADIAANKTGVASNVTALATKVDKVSGKELSANDFTDVLKTKLDGLANTTVTNNLTSTNATDALSANQGKVLKDLVDINTAKTGITTVQAADIAANKTGVASNVTALATKVDKVSGKELSANDFTNILKTKLDGLANTTVINDLTTGGTNNALSAEQGKTLQSSKAEKSNVLELDNTTTFTPDADYEPATKKYVDDNGITVEDILTSTSTANALSANQGKVLEDSKLDNDLLDATFFIGNGSDKAISKTITGDAIISNLGVLTIEDDAVDGTDIKITSEAAGSLMYNDGLDWVDLPAGTAGQMLVMNAGADAPEWVSTSSTGPSNTNTYLTSSVDVTFVLGQTKSIALTGSNFNSVPVLTGLPSGYSYVITSNSPTGLVIDVTAPLVVSPEATIVLDNHTSWNAETIKFTTVNDARYWGQDVNGAIWSNPSVNWGNNGSKIFNVTPEISQDFTYLNGSQLTYVGATTKTFDITVTLVFSSSNVTSNLYQPDIRWYTNGSSPIQDMDFGSLTANGNTHTLTRTISKVLAPGDGIYASLSLVGGWQLDFYSTYVAITPQ